MEHYGRGWKYPAYDDSLVRVFYESEDVDRLMDCGLVTLRHGVCVQAGGGVGLYPWRLAQHFPMVYTFEPDPHNFNCLTENVPQTEKGRIGEVVRLPYGLSALEGGEAMMARVRDEIRNAGAGYLITHKEIPHGAHRVELVALDSFEINVDLIWLDIEGMEELALRGAEETIRQCKPVIVCEQKVLPQGNNLARLIHYLQSLGYQEKMKLHRDVVWVHK